MNIEKLLVFSLSCGRLFSGDKRRNALILHKENEELRGFRFAGVATDDVYVLWTLVEGLAWDKRHFLAASDLHHNRPFENVDEDMGIMTMNRVRSSGCVFDRNHQGFLAWNSCQVLRQKRRNLLRLEPPVFRAEELKSQVCV